MASAATAPGEDDGQWGEAVGSGMYEHLLATFRGVMSFSGRSNEHGLLASQRKKALMYPRRVIEMYRGDGSEAFRMFCVESLMVGAALDRQLELVAMGKIPNTAVRVALGADGRNTVVESIYRDSCPESNWIVDCEMRWLRTTSLRKRRKPHKGAVLTKYGQEAVGKGYGPRQRYWSETAGDEITLSDRMKMGDVVVPYSVLRYRVVEKGWDLDRAAVTKAERTGRPVGAYDRAPRKRRGADLSGLKV